MAGGAEIDQEYCSDDDDWSPIDTAALKRRFKSKIQTRSSYLNMMLFFKCNSDEFMA
jgi:hypothetical protein